MNNSFVNKKVTFIINFAYIILILFIIFMAVKYFLPIVFPFVTGIMLCYIVEPTVQVMNNKLKIKRSIASAICIIIVITLSICVISLISATLYTQIKLLLSSLPRLFGELNGFINSLKNKDYINYFEKAFIIVYEYFSNIEIENITSMGVFDGLLNYFTGLFKSIPGTILSLIITFVFSVFLSSSFKDVRSFVYKHLSLKNQILMCQAKKSIVNVFKKYAKSYLTLMLVTFTELSIAFFIFNIKPVFSLALIISLIDILPIFGVGTIMIPWAAILLIGGEINDGIIILSIYLVITVIRQIIEPKIIGTGIGLPPVITLPAMYIGLRLFGVIGLFIAPIIITVVYDLNKRGYIKILY